MAKKPNITAEQLERYRSLNEERLDLSRKADAIEKEQKTLAAHFQAELTEAGQKTCVRGSMRVSLVEARGSLSYKDALIDEIGHLKVAELANAVPSKTKVVVETAESAAVKKKAA